MKAKELTVGVNLTPEAKRFMKTARTRLGGDWRSRTLWVGAGAILLVTATATACMFVLKPGGTTPVASFDQWSSFVMVTVPGIFSGMLIALGWEKHKLAKLIQSSLSADAGAEAEPVQQ